MSSSLFCSRRTVAQSTACTTSRLWLCTMVPGKCVMASHAWEKHGAGQQFCTTPDNSPSTPPQNGVRSIKVSEVEFSFNLGVKEYSWKGVVKEEGTWKQNGEGFIWAQHSEPKLFVHKILSSLYSKVYFLCRVTFKLGENGNYLELTSCHLF